MAQSSSGFFPPRLLSVLCVSAVSLFKSDRPSDSKGLQLFAPLKSVPFHLEGMDGGLLYKDEVEALVQWVNSSRPLPGVDRLYAPGEIEEAEHERRLREGIDVPASTWDAISAVAGDLGVAVPEV